MGWETLYVGKLLVEAEASAFLQSSVRANTKQWKKGQVWPFFGCCAADSQTDAGRHQLYDTSSLVLLSTAWPIHNTNYNC